MNLNKEGISWENTSCTIRENSKYYKTIKKLIDREAVIYNKKENEFIIYNPQEYCLLEGEFLRDCNELDNIIEKLKDKQKKECIEYVYFNNNGEGFLKKAEEDKKYKQILKNNNFHILDLFEEDIISPFFLDALFSKYEEDGFREDNEVMKALNHYRELFSLIAIAEKTIFSNEEFIFNVKNESSFSKTIKQSNSFCLSTCSYFETLKWIIRVNEEEFYTHRLNIVRSFIEEQGILDLKEENINDYETMLNKIIKQQTVKYFEQRSKMKDEILLLNKQSFEARQGLFKNLIGIIISISLAYYGLIFKNKNIRIFEENFAMGTVTLIMTIALFFSFAVFYKEFLERKKLYAELKDFYDKSFDIKNKTFNEYVKEPVFIKDNKFILTIMSIFIAILFCLILIQFNIKIPNFLCKE